MKPNNVLVGVLQADELHIDFKEVPNELESYHDIVGGYIDYVNIKDELGFYCNDEGLLENLPTSLMLVGSGDNNEPTITGRIAGDIAFVHHNNEGETVSLTDDDIKLLNEIIDIGLFHENTSDKYELHSTLHGERLL